MEQTQFLKENRITKALTSSDNPSRLLLTIVMLSVVLGLITGFVLSSKGGDQGLTSAGLGAPPAKNPETDTRTFKDFAEGVIKAKPRDLTSKENTGGTHLLIREDNAIPVTLTSSVVDLSKYEGKKVKVFGQTQAVPKVDWFMDVGKVEEIK